MVAAEYSLASASRLPQPAQGRVHRWQGETRPQSDPFSHRLSGHRSFSSCLRFTGGSERAAVRRSGPGPPSCLPNAEKFKRAATAQSAWRVSRLWEQFLRVSNLPGIGAWLRRPGLREDDFGPLPDVTDSDTEVRVGK